MKPTSYKGDVLPFRVKLTNIIDSLNAKEKMTANYAFNKKFGEDER